MSLFGNAALAMWWNMAPDMREDFEHWHSHEHFPERLGIPGFHRSSRWSCVNGGEGIFVMYELESFGVLSSPSYLERLNAPTPWSIKLMPHHRNMVRSQSHVLESRGGGVARNALTIRFSPKREREAELRQSLKALIEELSVRPGITGAHLLIHETPLIAQTTEQKIRGTADEVADWALVVCGYDTDAVQALNSFELSESSLVSLGAQPDQKSDFYSLSYSAIPTDVY
ncbi:hypothetical protein K814_0126025 [Pseudomonas fluorescens LMG 5329]|jgi:hypothetical protein|uniref:Uncharacterized protein n=1 Tax=Pseudomonas fluorescens LMG 5329 TaxID=1324332 RepID=A0A0A1YVZ3_PSEFL|nr:hypothetical protein K814_0126025 [Pseudomonas fluorescens LMG 5329]